MKIMKINCTESAGRSINKLAENIFLGHKETLRKMGIRRPSTKVAVDFLIYASRKCTDDTKDNLYSQMVEMETKNHIQEMRKNFMHTQTMEMEIDANSE